MSLPDRPPVVSAEQVVEVLNHELPGFEARIDRDESRFTTVMQVRTRIPFGGKLDLPDEQWLFLPVPQYALEKFVGDFITDTRKHAIELLGLQPTIDEIVEGQVREGIAKGLAQAREEGFLRAIREFAQEQQKQAPSAEAILAMRLGVSAEMGWDGLDD